MGAQQHGSVYLEGKNTLIQSTFGDLTKNVILMYISFSLPKTLGRLVSVIYNILS